MPSPSSATAELSRLSLEELLRERDTKRIEAARLRLMIDQGSEKNHAQYRTIRREIARLSTLITRKQRA